MLILKSKIGCFCFFNSVNFVFFISCRTMNLLLATPKIIKKITEISSLVLEKRYISTICFKCGFPQLLSPSYTLFPGLAIFVRVTDKKYFIIFKSRKKLSTHTHINAF